MKKIFFFLLFFGVQMPFLAAQNKKSNDNLSRDHVAIQGYDAVSYFKNEKPLKGDKGIQTTYQNAVYYFANEANKSDFVASPEKYTPQYGGWCAYAIGETGDKVSINPTTFKILDDKLYLFYNARSTNTLNLWNKKEGVLKTQGDKNWAQIVK